MTSEVPQEEDSSLEESTLIAPTTVFDKTRRAKIQERMSKKHKNPLLQVDEKTRVGNSVKTPNYLRYTKINPIWKVVLRNELRKTIERRGQQLLEGGFIPIMNKDKDVDYKETDFIVFKKDTDILLPTSPKIEKSAKNYLYKSLNFVGLKVLLGYNRHCRRSGSKIINQATVLKQWATTHGFKKTLKLVESFNNKKPNTTVNFKATKKGIVKK